MSEINTNYCSNGVGCTRDDRSNEDIEILNNENENTVIDNQPVNESEGINENVPENYDILSQMELSDFMKFLGELLLIFRRKRGKILKYLKCICEYLKAYKRKVELGILDRPLNKAEKS